MSSTVAVTMPQSLLYTTVFSGHTLLGSVTVCKKEFDCFPVTTTEFPLSGTFPGRQISLLAQPPASPSLRFEKLRVSSP